MEATPEQLRKRPKWKEDGDCLVCDEIGCDVKFGLTKRRHHCRGCGFVYCSEHCKATMTIPIFGYYTPQRVCHTCSIHGVVDPDLNEERDDKEKKRKKDKKSKKEKKDKKEKKKKSKEVEEEDPAPPATTTPQYPAGYQPSGPPPIAPQPGYQPAGPPPIPSHPGYPQQYPGSPPQAHPNPEVEALQQRINQLEAAVKQVQQNTSPSTQGPTEIKYRDYDGDQITMCFYSHGTLQYSVNGEDRPPFGCLRWHPDGPAFEFKDIETAMLLPDDCYKVISSVLALADSASLDHDISLDAFCPDCTKLNRLSKFCGVTGAAHEGFPEPLQPAAPAQSHALPLPNELNKAATQIQPPAAHEPVFADDWSSGSDDSDWDNPKAGRGAARPAPPPSSLLALGPPPAVAYAMQNPIPPANQLLAILPQQPAPAIMQQPQIQEVQPQPQQPQPVHEDVPVVLPTAAPISPAPALINPATPPPGAAIPGMGIPRNMIALEAAAGRVKLRSATITKKPEVCEKKEEEPAQQFGRHMLKTSTVNIRAEVAKEEAEEGAAIGQHLLKSTAKQEAKPEGAAVEVKEEPTVVGQHLLKSSAQLRPSESPKLEANVPPGQHLLKASFNKPLESEQEEALKEAEPTPAPVPEPAPVVEESQAPPPAEEPAKPRKDASDSDSSGGAPSKPAAKKGLKGMLAKRRAADSDSDDSDDW